MAADNVLGISSWKLLRQALRLNVTATLGANCPECGELLSQMANEPTPGAPALCLCGAKLIVTDSLGVRSMTEADRQRLAELDPGVLLDLDKLADDFRWLAGLGATRPGFEEP